MSADDVKLTINDAILFTGIRHVTVVNRPRLLSDNGPCYISKALSDYLEEEGIGHTRGKPYHPMTQGKIERYHRSMKNLILLEYYYSPSELEDQIGVFVDYYNNDRYHEALNNVTPADVYYGRDLEVLERREQIKQKTMLLRRKQNRTLRLAEKAGKVYMGAETLSIVFDPICPKPFEDIHERGRYLHCQLCQRHRYERYEEIKEGTIYRQESAS